MFFRNEQARNEQARKEALQTAALKFQQAEACERQGDVDGAEEYLAQAVQYEQIALTIPA